MMFRHRYSLDRTLYRRILVLGFDAHDFQWILTLLDRLLYAIRRFCELASLQISPNTIDAEGA